MKTITLRGGSMGGQVRELDDSTDALVTIQSSGVPKIVTTSSGDVIEMYDEDPVFVRYAPSNEDCSVWDMKILSQEEYDIECEG